MIEKNFLINPDWEVRSQIRFKGGMPDLWQFDRVFISCSGGKDSQAMAYVIANLATLQGYPKENIELIYADTGLEWHDTFKHVQEIGNALGISAVQVLPKYKLLDNVRRRWYKFNGIGTEFAEREREHKQPRRKDGSMASPFPNYAQRFCNSDHKRLPLEQYIRRGGGGNLFQTSGQDGVPADKSNGHWNLTSKPVPVNDKTILHRRREEQFHIRAYPALQNGGWIAEQSEDG